MNFNGTKTINRINVFTLAAVEVVIENRRLLDSGIENLIRERDRVYTELQKRKYVRVFPSSANFLLIRTPKTARELFDRLYSQGVLVRDVSAYPQLDRCVRASISTPEDNDRFLAALDRALENN